MPELLLPRREGLGRLPPPSPLDALRAVLNAPPVLEALWRACRAYPPFPEGGSHLFATLILQAAGLAVPYTGGPAWLAKTLLARRWKAVKPDNAPRAGDLFFVAQASRPVHVGFVVKVGISRGEAPWFMALDSNVETSGEQAFRPFRRDTVGIGFWLRPGGYG